MLKPLDTEFKGRRLSLECTHRTSFPPPQMYGHTLDDIDNLWKQGNIDQNQHQLLKTWADKCGQMVMGPRCLDCPLALKRNPRPGRPDVIETENWLEAKRRMHWDDMKAAKATQMAEAKKAEQTQAKQAQAEEPKRGFVKTAEAVVSPVVVPPEKVEPETSQDVWAQVEAEEAGEGVGTEAEAYEVGGERRTSSEEGAVDLSAMLEEPAPEPEPEPEKGDGLDEDILEALADD